METTRNVEVGNILVTTGISPAMIGTDVLIQVILLVTQVKDGKISGLVINRESGKEVCNVLKNFPEFDAPIYIGGTIQTTTLFFLHTLANRVVGDKVVSEIHCGGDFEELKKTIAARELYTEQLRFFTGCCEWEKEELEKQISKRAWIILRFTTENAQEIEDVCFSEDSRLWSTLLEKYRPKHPIKDVPFVSN